MTDSGDVPLSNRKAFLIIFLAGICAHGLLPFMEIIVSDDWFTLLADRTASVKGAWEGAVFLSMPLTVIQALPFFLIGDNLPVLRSINFGVLVANGWVFYLLLCELRAFDRQGSLIAAVVSVVFPGYLVHFMVSFLFYPLGLLLFLSGLVLVLKAEESPPSKRLRYFLPAMVMVFYSFHLGALLVFYAFFIIAHFFFRRRLLAEGFFQAVSSYLNQRFLFLLLPFWFWGFRQAFALFFPTWESYNQPALKQSVILAGIDAFATNYGRTILTLLWSSWFLIPMIVLTVLLGLRRSFERPSVTESSRDTRHSFGWLLVGLLVLAAGVAPFILVGKYPLLLPIEWRDKTAFDLASRQILLVIDSRMDLFAGLAAGVIVVAALGLLRSLLFVPSLVCSTLAISFIISSCAFQVSNYLHLEKKAIAMAAVRDALRKDARLKDTRIFGVVDRIGNISTTWDSWTLFFREVWGDTEHFGVPERWYGDTLNRSLVYNRDSIINRLLYGGAWFRYFEKPPFASDQATLVISHGPAESRLSALGAFVRYSYLKHFAPEKLSSFLTDFTRVDVFAKRNLEKDLATADYAKSWRELKPSKNSDLSSPYLFESAMKPLPVEGADDNRNLLSENADARNDGAQVRVASDGQKRGRFVAFEFEFKRALTTLELDGINLVGERHGDLSSVRQWKDHRLVIYGLVGLAETSVRYQSTDNGIPKPIFVRAFESPPDFDPGVVFLTKPYIFPEVVAPEKFVSAVALSDRIMPAALWRDFERGQNWPFAETQSGVTFAPQSLHSSLVSDLIGFDANRTAVLFVDWPQVSPDFSGGVLRLEDHKGKKILDVIPENLSEPSYLIVPAWPSLTGVSIRLLSRTGQPFVLPRNVAFFQIDSLANLKAPLSELVPR